MSHCIKKINVEIKQWNIKGKRIHKKTHILFSYFVLAARELDWLLDDALLFSAPPPPFLFLAFRFSPFAFFSLFCCCTVFFCRSSFLPSPAGGLSCFSPLADVFPLFFMRRRGVVEMVLRLGGFFSSLRLALLNIQHNWTWLKTFTILVTACFSCRKIKAKNSSGPTAANALDAATFLFLWMNEWYRQGRHK